MSFGRLVQIVLIVAFALGMGAGGMILSMQSRAGGWIGMDGQTYRIMAVPRG